MLLARISFVPQFDHEEPELTSIAQAFLTSLLKNGQICGDYVVGWADGILDAYVYASHRESLLPKYHSMSAENDEAWVIQQFGLPPEIELLDDDCSLPSPTLNSARSVYLFTAALRDSSPLVHGNRGTPLALPLLPISDSLREQLFFWQRRYQRVEGLWSDGTLMEQEFSDLLTNPDSDLMAEARQLARDVELAVEKPVYVYLLRFQGTDRAMERDIPCPGCGKPWFDETSPAPSMEPFYRFHFQCDDCRLVSHMANVFDNEQHPADEPTDE